MSTTSRSGWLIGGAVFTVAALVIGGVTLWSTLLGASEPGEATEKQTYNQQVTRIELEVDRGAVTLVAGEAGQVAVERHFRWSSEKPKVTERWDGGILRISTECTADEINIVGHATCDVDYTLAVPAGVEIEAHTNSGAVVSRNLTGALKLGSTSGDITVTKAGGALRLEATSGKVKASELSSAEVDVQSSSGGVELAFATAPRKVRAEANSGDVRVTVPKPDAYRVEAQTNSGQESVTVAQDGGATRTISAQTNTGDVDVRYVAG
ncbi:hypothetical protein Lfu02_10220 [Longispora fulva]|uniref:DUF4097 and DUF4098 domain-containing protein YvlB n=1 Tax=Longispora fulva TaxID=619741 RepID=A0A8J7G8X6_9ACTN|nr:DUF4097 family beta strand repeat-containing protein [Longispora fulva]MBG6135115.1 DUF4097 and DUF4098 domain-containing protein YvlB [Longispora fulva]GIG56650.1 hypothetical protein Lfu02_10220 [Longispora fulva]